MHLLDFFFLLRPILLIPVWVIFLLGYHRAGGTVFNPSHYFLAGFVTFTLLMGAVYIINQIADIETDRMNKKLFILPEGLVSVKFAYIEVSFLIAAVFALSFYFQPIYRLFLLISLILGFFYSVRPFKFKSRPFLDLLSNASGHGFLAFSIGWLSFREFSFDTFVYSIPYFFAVGGVFLLCTVIDIRGDIKTGQRTTGVHLGERVTMLLALFMIILSVISSALIKDFICLPVAAISTFFFILLYASRRSIAVHKEDVGDTVRERRFLLFTSSLPVYLLTLVCCVIYQWFFVILVLLVLLTRFYFKRRFNIVYPKV